MASKILMSEEEVRRALIRISHEILEKNQGVDDMVIIGIHTRGVPLAKRLQSCIQEFENKSVPVGSVDFRLYRDDLENRNIDSTSYTKIPVTITDRKVILVDDVLFTGRSIRAAMDALMDLGRPKSIQLAVLIDRGHRELPLRADYVGKNIPTSLNERVEVHMSEIDGGDEVVLKENSVSESRNLFKSLINE